MNTVRNSVPIDAFRIGRAGAGVDTGTSLGGGAVIGWVRELGGRVPRAGSRGASVATRRRWRVASEGLVN